MPRIGVLALQGSFKEHCASLRRCNVDCMEVRTVADLEACDGLIIPGGESTTMAHVAHKTGMLDALRTFVSDTQRPVWGTCAGLIFLAESAEGSKQGGQELLQCMKIHVSRNFFGAQISSFEQLLPAHSVLQAFGGPDTYRAIFIRAPAILRANSDAVTVLSEYQCTAEEAGKAGQSSVIVAAACGNLLATAFHPELTDDLRWCALRIVLIQSCHLASGQGLLRSSWQHIKLTRSSCMPSAMPCPFMINCEFEDMHQRCSRLQAPIVREHGGANKPAWSADTAHTT